MLSSAETDRRLRESWVAVRSRRQVLVLSGDDRKSWLQGQITQDLRLLGEDQPLPYCLCTPTGQLLGFGLVFEKHDALWLTIDRPAMAHLRERVERNVVLEDVRAEVLAGPTWTLYGPDAAAVAAQESEWTLPHFDGPAGGVDAYRAVDQWGEMPCPEVIQAALIESGTPVLGQDTDAKTLPPELGERFDRAHVSHTKGCYTGQEVLHRIFARGHTNKVWRGLRSEQALTKGASLTLSDGTSVGTVLRVAESPRWGWLATAMLRHEAAAAGTLVHEGAQEATVVELPLNSTP